MKQVALLFLILFPVAGLVAQEGFVIPKVEKAKSYFKKKEIDLTNYRYDNVEINYYLMNVVDLEKSSRGLTFGGSTLTGLGAIAATGAIGITLSNDDFLREEAQIFFLSQAFGLGATGIILLSKAAKDRRLKKEQLEKLRLLFK